MDESMENLEDAQKQVNSKRNKILKYYLLFPTLYFLLSHHIFFY